jgi:hypothetical protein
MGEAKRRKAWIAAGGKDWGLVGYRNGEVMATQRADRRAQHKASLMGLVAMAAALIAASRGVWRRAVDQMLASLRARGLVTWSGPRSLALTRSGERLLARASR